jgi:isochorismate synthase
MLRTILEKVKQQHEAGKPFVLYNVPGSRELYAFFQQGDKSHVVSDFTETGFVLAPFSGETIFLIPADDSEMVSEVYEIPEIADDNATANRANNGKDDFETIVRKGIEAIEQSQFGKVVLSRNETAELGNNGFELIFQKLLFTYPTAFRYCWYHPDTGIWMGATPEKLLASEDTSFSTVALAGTQKFEGFEQVAWQQKEREEQQFVTDFISENLKEKTVSLDVSEPYTARAGNLLHIKTDIRGELKDSSSLKEVLDILHPTPAVCGYPKEAAKKFILENEGYDREFYTGFLGVMNFPSDGRNTSDLYVNLRCMKISGDQASIYVGCGITKDSDPEKEYIETVNKSMTMKKILI